MKPTVKRGKTLKIINFGSMNLDKVYHVDHFVLPGETLMSEGFETNAGGKGLNQSVAAARAGSQVCHAGKIGVDGRMLRDLLKSSGVNVEHVKESSCVTGHAIIQVDRSGQNCILLHSGANYDIGEDFIDSVLSEFDSGDILLLQNEIANNAYIIETARRKGLRIALNPSPVTKEISRLPLDAVEWFLLNEIEGRALTGTENPEKIAEILLDRFPGCAVVLTLGKEGVIYQDAARRLKHGIYRVDRVDTTGAGDTFTGYFISGVAQGLAMEEILRRASVASSLAVSKKGAAASIPEIQEVLDSDLAPVE